MWKLTLRRCQKKKAIKQRDAKFDLDSSNSMETLHKTQCLFLLS